MKESIDTKMKANRDHLESIIQSKVDKIEKQMQRNHEGLLAAI